MKGTICYLPAHQVDQLGLQHVVVTEAQEDFRTAITTSVIENRVGDGALSTTTNNAATVEGRAGPTKQPRNGLRFAGPQPHTMLEILHPSRTNINNACGDSRTNVHQ